MSKYIDFSGVKYLWKQIVSKIHTEVDDAIQSSIVIQGHEDVLQVIGYGGLAPRSASEGDYYINKLNNRLYQYTSGSWTDVTRGASSAVLYITTNATHVLTYSTTQGFREVSQEYIDSKVATKANATHTHAISDVTNLQEQLDEIRDIAELGLVM